MQIPTARRRSIAVLASVLFAANLFAIVFAVRSGISEIGASAQYAGSALAQAPTTQTAPSDNTITRTCNPGEVQTIRQAQKGTDPEVTTNRCYARNSQGQMVPGPDAAQRSCQLSKQEACVVQYCPPQDALKTGKAGTCFVVNCSGSANCLGQTVAKLRSGGPASVIRDTLLADSRTAALAPGTTGAINGSEFLTQVLNPTLAKDIQNTSTGEDASAIERISQIAKAVETNNAPCTGAGCTPTVQLNKDLVDAQRLGQGGDERGTVRIPGGKGLPPPPLSAPPPPASTGFKFPNIHKDPSGTDVFAWMKHLMGGSDASNPSNCSDTPAPAPAQCSGGTWMSEQVNGCKSWRCIRPRILSFSAIPQELNSGESANLGWITEGMKTCVVSSADLPDFTQANAGYTNVNGAVKTPALTATAMFELSCEPTSSASSTTKSLTIGVLP